MCPGSVSPALVRRQGTWRCLLPMSSHLQTLYNPASPGTLLPQCFESPSPPPTPSMGIQKAGLPEAGAYGQGLQARCRLARCRRWGLCYTICPSPQGSNGTFLLSTRGPDAEAFSVSPERAAGSVDVQVLVRAPALVDYERKTVMLVQVRGALGTRECGPWTLWPQCCYLFPVLRSWPLIRSVGTPLLPW